MCKHTHKIHRFLGTVVIQSTQKNREKMQTPHRRCKLHCSSSVSYITVPPMNANKLKSVRSKLVEDTGGFLTLFSFILPMWTSQKLIVFLYFRREKVIIE